MRYCFGVALFLMMIFSTSIFAEGFLETNGITYLSGTFTWTEERTGNTEHKDFFVNGIGIEKRFSRMESKGIAEYYRSGEKERFDITNISRKAWDKDGNFLPEEAEKFGSSSPWREVKLSDRFLSREVSTHKGNSHIRNSIRNNDGRHGFTISEYSRMIFPFRQYPNVSMTPEEKMRMESMETTEKVNPDGTKKKTITGEVLGRKTKTEIKYNTDGQIIEINNLQYNEETGSYILNVKRSYEYKLFKGKQIMSVFDEKIWMYNEKEELFSINGFKAEYYIDSISCDTQPDKIFSWEGIGADLEKEEYADYRSKTPKRFNTPDDRLLKKK